MSGSTRRLLILAVYVSMAMSLANCVMPGGYGMPYGGEDEGGDEMGGFGMMPAFGWGGGFGGFEGWHEGDDD